VPKEKNVLLAAMTFTALAPQKAEKIGERN
jgi:hypothetical protein